MKQSTRSRVAQWYSAELPGVRVPAGAGNLSLHHHVQTGSGPPSLLSNGCQWLFPWG